MKLHFLGANRQVTGSRYCLEASGKQVLIDCGMFQERAHQCRNWEPNPIPPAEVEALLLTHVHIDHSGLIPRFVRQGFHNPIYATRASVELAEVMLRDAAEIQVEDAEYKKKRHRKEGRCGPHPEEPLFTQRDVDQTLPLFRGVPYKKPIPVTDEITVTFHDAGHILGSAMLELAVVEDGKKTRIVFSGDIGQWNKPIIRDPTLLDAADYVVMESTYGDRNHERAGDIGTQLADIINETHARGGHVVIPTFAVERAQELMYHISRLVHTNRIPDMPIFLDSPMAVDVTEIYRRCQDCFDQEMWQLMTSKEPPLRFPGLRFASSVAESKAINEVRRPAIIMASSGMCNAGRIKHHLRANIGRPESTILFVGYQGVGTLGRIILDGAPRVRIHGREFPVKAQVRQIFGFSGHADRDALHRWIDHFQPSPRKIFLTHGEEVASLALEAYLRDERQLQVRIPEYQEVVEL